MSRRRSARRVGVALCAVLALTLSGCVSGYGRCLLLAPAKNTLTGRVHWPGADSPASLPRLKLDDSAYLYTPSSGMQCSAADEFELDVPSELQDKLVEGARVSVRGGVFETSSDRFRTRFAIDVVDVLPGA